MKPQKLTDYELQRLQNIRRNNEMMAALKLHSKATQLSNFKRQRVEAKSTRVKLEKKPKTETPIVISVRRSLRTRGIPPDCEGLNRDSVAPTTLSRETPPPVSTTRSKEKPPSVSSLGPLSMATARASAHSDSSFIESLMGMAQDVSVPKGNAGDSLELESLSLYFDNIARVVSGRITNVRFFPTNSVKMIAAGNKFGNIGFWNMGESEVHLYRPHNAPISGILIQSHCCSKIYTSCYDGILRLMDAEKEIFDLVFESDETIYALSQPPNETNCLYLAEGSGGLTMWDNRVGKLSSHWDLHDSRINTIDFNCQNPHIVATSSSDATACTWDLRYTNRNDLTALRTVTHKRSVHSAYFSPSGGSLATTSAAWTILLEFTVELTWRIRLLFLISIRLADGFLHSERNGVGMTNISSLEI
ncbi:WD repeat-containing protein 76-like isoform X3 [Vigna umbellata]|uniref:WD repeat-containing protein 76-like isoform X3 n=1 Tax=Vigna umbellata TaxID=87088 RepID=UPI001F5F26FB|nr:WD repeat-containing protein 76-like isoform X3 [Vigna umbellata]